MPARRFPLALIFVLLPLAACQKTEVTSYRIPKEKDPELPAAAAPMAGAGTGTMPVTAGPAVGATTDMASTAVPTAEGDALVWTAPSSWAVGAAVPMRKATYKVSPSGGELSVTAFPNDVGGELANLNRWRGQLHLAPMSEAEMAAQIARMSSHGLTFATVDFTGPAAAGATAQRLLGAIVPFNGATWFFKLTGPEAVIAAERTHFQEFLASVQPPHPTSP